MGIAPAQFQSAGQSTEHLIPGVYSRRNNVPSIGGVSTGRLCIIGNSVSGKPLTLLEFANVADAKGVLVQGDLLEGIAHAFTGSNTYTPQKVLGIRINNGTRSQRELQNNGKPVISVKSFDYGIKQNQIKMMVENGTDFGKKVSVAFGDNNFSIDNIEKKSLEVSWSKDNDVTLAINKTGITINGAPDVNVEIAIDSDTTLSYVSEKINEIEGLSCEIINGNDNAKANLLDFLPATVINKQKNLILTSSLEEFINKLKTISVIGEVSVVGDRVLPDNDANFVFFTGAENGTSTVTDYIKALEVLETEDIQILATPTTDKDVHNLIKIHCIQMSSTAGKKERTFFVGMPTSTSIEKGIEEAKSLNTELGSVLITGANCACPLLGKNIDINAGLLACKVAGMEVAMGVSNPLTNKVINVNSFSKKYNSTELEKMIAGGVMPFGENEDGELVCIRGITCYQSDNLIMNERSMIRSVLFMDRDIRKAYARRIGSNEEPSESSIIQILQSKADTWYTNELLTKDDNGNLVFNISVKFDGDKTYLAFSRNVRAPNNFNFITGTNQIYRTVAL